MKINELLEPRIVDKTTMRSIDPKAIKNKDDIIGNGNFSYVRNSKTKENLVKKSSSSVTPAELDDGFYLYIKEIVDKKLMGVNPYFPIVLSAKRIKNQKGESIHNFEIEKLIPFNRAEFSKTSVALLRALGQKAYDAAMLNVRDDDSDDTKNYFLLEKLSDMLHNLPPQYLEDGQLSEAADLIERVASKNKNSLTKGTDYKPDNFMFRAKGSSYELVISDPIA